MGDYNVAITKPVKRMVDERNDNLPIPGNRGSNKGLGKLLLA